MRGRGLAVLAALLLPLSAFAAPLDSSLRPKPRPSAEAPAKPQVARASKTRPKTRPDAAKSVAEGRAKPRPKLFANLKRKAAAQPKPGSFSKKGSICGSNAIKGTPMQPVKGRLRGCGVAKPVKITSVQGVALSTPSTMDCGTAQALDKWVRAGVLPAIDGRGGGVAKLKVAAHYSCRTRNNQPGAKLSEHGKGRAIDISGLVLKDGTTITLLKHWRSKAWGPALKQMHKAACGPFGTVLGPNADRFHQDHFHFDTARYRSGSYCR